MSTKYFCDICGREARYLKRDSITIEGAEMSVFKFYDNEVCESCLDRLREAVESAVKFEIEKIRGGERKGGEFERMAGDAE